MDSDTRTVRLCTGLRQRSVRELLQGLTLSCEKNISEHEAGRIRMRNVHVRKDGIPSQRVIRIRFLVNSKFGRLKVHANWGKILSRKNRRLII